MSFTPVHDTPFELRVAQGLVSGITAINKFGRNPDVDIGTEDIWFSGGIYVPPTAARIHAIVSASAADASAGTGARTVTINGLNGSYVDTTETVTLNGTTPVNTVNSFVFINRALVATAGSGGVNAGNITATAATDATISLSIAAGKGQTQLGIYMIPAGKTAYLTKYRGSMDASTTASVEIELFATPFGGALNLKGTLILMGSGTTSAEKRYETPISFTEKTLIRLRATSDTNNVNVVGSFDLYLVTN